MSNHKHLLEDPAFLADLAGDTVAPALANKWGTGTTFIKTHRRIIRSAPNSLPERSIIEEGSDGSRSIEFIRTRPVTLDDARAWIRSTGDDPDDYNISVRSIAYGADQSSNRMAATPKTGKTARKAAPVDDLFAAIDSWKPARHTKRASAPSDKKQTLVVCAADLQAGKVDFGRNSHDLIARVMQSFQAAADIARETRFNEIILADLGDIVENINSTSSQRGTNDLAITEQIRVARRLMLEGIKLLAPLTDSLIYVAVPSNHGSVRIGPKSPENHVLDDYGIEIAEQLRDVCNESDKLANVSFRIPEESLESLAVTTSGTTLGFAHGHQAQGADGLGKWWQGQSHGRMPLAGADIALFGHFHSLRVQQSGDARWLMVAPASDNGSSWFTNKTGERSKAGMLTFITSNGEWSDLKVL